MRRSVVWGVLTLWLALVSSASVGMALWRSVRWARFAESSSRRKMDDAAARVQERVQELCDQWTQGDYWLYEKECDNESCFDYTGSREWCRPNFYDYHYHYNPWPETEKEECHCVVVEETGFDYVPLR